MFVHLHGHGTYSMLEWIWSVKSILAKCQSLGMESIAITDYYGIYGAIDLYRAAKDFWINPIIGVEIGFVESIQSIHSNNTIWNIVIIAMNNAWYENLLSLVTLSYQNLIHHKPCIDFSLLAQYSEWLIGFMGWKNSTLGIMIEQGEKESIQIEFCSQLENIFGKDNFYWEVVAQDYIYEPEIEVINNAIVNLSQKMNLSMIVTSNFHYVDSTDKAAYELALAIKDGNKIYDEERRKVLWNYHIFSESEIIEIMKKNGFDQGFIDTLIGNTQLIADRCSVKLDLYQSLFPNYEPWETILDLYEKNKSNIVEA